MSEHYKMMGSNRWRTPPDIAARVHKLFGGPPDLDPASDEEANKIVQAKQYLGLSDVHSDRGIPNNWGDAKTVFINPPGGKHGNITLAKLLWETAYNYNRQKDVEVLWFAYNINQLQTLQKAKTFNAPNLLVGTHICIPDRRLGCIDATTGLLQEDPPSACAFVYLPSWKNKDAEDRFTLAFGDLGMIYSQPTFVE